MFVLTISLVTLVLVDFAVRVEESRPGNVCRIISAHTPRRPGKGEVVGGSQASSHRRSDAIEFGLDLKRPLGAVQKFPPTDIQEEGHFFLYRKNAKPGSRCFTPFGIRPFTPYYIVRLDN